LCFTGRGLDPPIGAGEPVRLRARRTTTKKGPDVNESYSRWWVLLMFGVLLLLLAFVVHVSK
jgi:hypothetical protein